MEQKREWRRGVERIQGDERNSRRGITGDEGIQERRLRRRGVSKGREGG